MSDTLKTLTAGSRRPKVHDAQLVTKVPQAAKDLVVAEAVRNEVTESDIVRLALAEYFERRGLGK